MIKIKVSYENEHELNKIISLFDGLSKKVKIPKKQKGTYKKAYIIVDDML